MPTTNRVQSILIPVTWTHKQIATWFGNHPSFQIKKIHKTKNFYRFRQFAPKKNAKYMTKKLSSGVEFVIDIS